MRIAFVDGPWPGFGHRTQRWAHKNPMGNINPPPLFQMYAAAVARQNGHEVRLWDCPPHSLGYEKLIPALASYDPQLISVNTSTASFDHDMELARRLRDALPSAWVVAVGTHASAIYSDILEKDLGFDAIALGEFDRTISSLADRLGGGRPAPAGNGNGSGGKHALHAAWDALAKAAEGLPGIAFRRDGKPFARHAMLDKNLDALPWPAYDLIDIHAYWESMFPWRKRPIATLWTSRGCQFHCNFCLYTQILFQDKLRFRDLTNVLDEIRFMKERYGVKFFYFEDDNFTASWRRVEEFCHRVIREKLDITWGCLSTVQGVTDERARLMRASGCFVIKYGVESGSEEQLNYMEKQNALEEVEQTFRVTKRAGITIHATAMVGAPNETRESLARTIQYVKKLAPDSVQFSLCTPLPGTRFYDECKQKGLLKFEKWEDFDGVTGGVISYPAGLDRDEIKAARNKAYMSYYASPEHLTLRLRRTLYGPDRASQVLRNVYLGRRLLHRLIHDV